MIGFNARHTRHVGLGVGALYYTTLHPVLPAAILPYWLLALLFAVLPALRLRAAIRTRRRRRAGHCPRCGYDLRATPERCPECGMFTAETRWAQSDTSAPSASPR